MDWSENCALLSSLCRVRSFVDKREDSQAFSISFHYTAIAIGSRACHCLYFCTVTLHHRKLEWACVRCNPCF